MKRVTASAAGVSRFVLGLDQRDLRQISSALGHRLERLALVIDPAVTQKLSTGSGKQQDLDATGPEAFELRRGLKACEIGAGHVVDRSLVLLERADIVLE